MGVAVVAAVSDMDNTAHLDTQDRETGHHREVVCATNVQQLPHRPVLGDEQAQRRRQRRQDRGQSRHILSKEFESEGIPSLADKF